MENIINTDNAACGFTDISGVKEDTDCAAPEQHVEESRHVADDGNGGRKISAVEKGAECGSVGETKPIQPNEADAEEKLAVSSEEARNCVNSAGDVSEAEKEDREFLELIKGRYRDAYRRRTESIIRRRLKSVRTRTADGPSDASVSEKCETVCAADGISDSGCKKGTVNKEIADTVNRADNCASDTLGALDTRSGLISATGGFDGAQAKERAEIQKNANRNRPRENGVGGSVGMITGINVSALKGSDVLELLRRAEAGEKIKFK